MSKPKPHGQDQPNNQHGGRQLEQWKLWVPSLVSILIFGAGSYINNHAINRTQKETRENLQYQLDKQAKDIRDQQKELAYRSYATGVIDEAFEVMNASISHACLEFNGVKTKASPTQPINAAQQRRVLNMLYLIDENGGLVGSYLDAISIPKHGGDHETNLPVDALHKFRQEARRQLGLKELTETTLLNMKATQANRLYIQSVAPWHPRGCDEK